MRDDLASQHAPLDCDRQVADKGQPPTHPAGAAVETAREVVLRHAEAQVQLLQPEPLLKSRLGAAGANQSAEQQRLGLGQLPARRADRVLSQPTQRVHPLVPIDDHVLRGLLGRDHDDRQLLAVRRERRQDPPLALRRPHPQVLVPQHQLLMLELDHHTVSRMPSGYGAARRRAISSRAAGRGKSGPISPAINDLQAQRVSRPGVQDSAGNLNQHSGLKPDLVSRGSPVDSS